MPELLFSLHEVLLHRFAIGSSAAAFISFRSRIILMKPSSVFSVLIQCFYSVLFSQDQKYLWVFFFVIKFSISLSHYRINTCRTYLCVKFRSRSPFAHSVELRYCVKQPVSSLIRSFFSFLHVQAQVTSPSLFVYLRIRIYFSICCAPWEAVFFGLHSAVSFFPLCLFS